MEGGELYWATFESEEDQLPAIMALIAADLSEPYSVYTYRYFLHSWPWLCHLAYAGAGHGGPLLGAILGKVSLKKKPPERLKGYIAMVAVEPAHRGRGIGAQLVERMVRSMQAVGVHEIVLETEATNAAATRLYERSGFFKDKKLPNYYWNGSDAYRLKLLLAPAGTALDAAP